MSKPVLATNSFFSTNLDESELEHILRRIDDNLALRPILREQAQETDGSSITDALLAMSDQHDLLARLQNLYVMQAPLFVIKGRNLPNLLKRVLNLPIRVFGRKQLRFNRELLELAELFIADTQALRQHAAYQQQREHLLQAKVEAQIEQQLNLSDQLAKSTEIQEQILQGKQGQNKWLEQLAADQQGQHKWLEQLAADQQGQHKWLEQLAADQQGQHKWLEQLAADQQGQHKGLEQLAADQQGQHKWIQILQRKQEMLALDLRERISSPAEARSVPQARIVDPERYQQRLESMGEFIRVNLGCGEKPLPDYINIDFRELPEVDIVGDIRALPFEPGTLAEIASAHLIEHFKEHHLRTTILPYWKSLLRLDGAVRIICPNWAAMLERLNDGRLTLATFKLLTFGTQDYEGDDHFAMYTPETLSNVLRESGFTNIEVLVTERMNDICPEMEIVAYP